LAGGSTNGNSYESTGRENDGTGLYFYRARYYSPTFQRFIAQDPIGFAGDDTNLYAYVGNDSIDFIDPIGTGKIGKVVGGTIGAVVGALGEGAEGAAEGTIVNQAAVRPWVGLWAPCWGQRKEPTRGPGLFSTGLTN